MQVLLDTHAFLWWLAGDSRLTAAARRIIEDDTNTILVSAASAWEIATKFRLGKLPRAGAVALDVNGCLAGQGFSALSITVDDAERAGRLTGPHRDPFDRMIAAQALARDIPIVSVDRSFDAWGVRRMV
ncbi:MAG: type II toxin-antitoxin system VapC family toxin [bacterium]|nr:type II toxin-antitoxin system VapC family toxin [bacterium]